MLPVVLCPFPLQAALCMHLSSGNKDSRVLAETWSAFVWSSVQKSVIIYLISRLYHIKALYSVLSSVLKLFCILFL